MSIIATIPVTRTKYANRFILGEPDELLLAAVEVPLDEEITGLYCHADPTHALPIINGKRVPYGPEVLANTIKSLDDHREHKLYQLMMCEAGKLSDGLASNTARISHSILIASTEKVHAYTCQPVVYDPVADEYVPGGRWVTFNSHGWLVS